MSSKRILILTNRVPYPLTDGGNLAMKAMIDGYAWAGWEVCLLAMNTTRHYISPEVLATIYKNVRFETVEVDNRLKPLPTIANYLFSSLPNHAMRFNNDRYRQKLVSLLAEYKPHAVQLESVFLSAYLPELKSSGAVLVLRMHNIEWQVWQRFAKETKSPLKKMYFDNLANRIRKYEELVWRQYDLLLPITDVDAQAMSALNTDILTIPFGIDASVSVTGNTGNWKAYHIGAMDWLPNAEAIAWFLKEVWPGIHNRFPQLEFHFAGRNMPDSFKTLFVPGAVCAGEVKDAAQFISDKNILIVPLRSGGGIRVKILEAMAQGKLVISTATGMQGIDAKPGADYLQADTEQDFIAAISLVFADAGKSAGIARNGAKLVRDRYDKHTLMQKLAAKMDDMLKKQGV